MADIKVKVFQAGLELATKLISSPVTAAEAIAGLRDANAGWVGLLTEPDNMKMVLGKQKLIHGHVYHYLLQEPAGKICNEAPAQFRVQRVQQIRMCVPSLHTSFFAFSVISLTNTLEHC